MVKLWGRGVSGGVIVDCTVFFISVLLNETLHGSLSSPHY